MAYNTGEIPKVGDCICDKHHRRGVVSRILMWGSATAELVIRWEDGTTGIRHRMSEDFELLYRQLEVLDAK